MNRFVVKTDVDGIGCAIFAKVEVRDPRDGQILYRAGEKVPVSEGTRAWCEKVRPDLEHRYAVIAGAK